jgi:tripartite-type tricarboxylate transporter receptor subunit TctC
MKRYLTAVVTLAAALSWCPPGFAQTYPAKPVRLIVPYGAGGPNDVLGRLLAQKLGELWGQQMVVENRPGAGANIGMSAAAKSAPDGYTLMIAGSSAITVNPSLYRSMPLDPAKDLAPIIRFASAPMVMTVSADFPASTLAEFIALARKAPRNLNVCALGAGTGPALAAELFKQLSGVTMVDITYRSVPQCHASVISGETAVFFDGPLILSLVKAKRLKALGVTARTRLALAPEVPTMEEAGLAGVELSLWYALYGPAGLDAERQARLRADVAGIVARLEVRAQLNSFGYETEDIGPDELRRLIPAETASWAKVIRAAKWSLD